MANCLRSTPCGNRTQIQYLAASFEAVARALDEVDGWLTLEQARMLYDRARVLPPQGRVVEIGSHHGRSTIALALGAPVGAEIVADRPVREAGTTLAAPKRRRRRRTRPAAVQHEPGEGRSGSSASVIFARRRSTLSTPWKGSRIWSTSMVRTAFGCSRRHTAIGAGAVREGGRCSSMTPFPRSGSRSRRSSSLLRLAIQVPGQIEIARRLPRRALVRRRPSVERGAQTTTSVVRAERARQGRSHHPRVSRRTSARARGHGLPVLTGSIEAEAEPVESIAKQHRPVEATRVGKRPFARSRHRTGSARPRSRASAIAAGRTSRARLPRPRRALGRSAAHRSRRSAALRPGSSSAFPGRDSA